MLHHTLGFATCWRGFFLSTEGALGFLQRLFVTTEKARLVHPGVVTERGKSGQSDIDPCHQGRWWQGCGLHLNGETRMPPSQAITTQGQRFDDALDGTMQGESQAAQLRDRY